MLTRRKQPNVKYLDQLSNTIQADQLRMTALKAAQALELPDCWIAAGFIRNYIWDQVFESELPPVKSDIDVIYFDPGDTRQKSEKEIEGLLQSQQPICSEKLGSWSVKNQARMHHVNRDRPYQNCQDAMAHWPETVTAIAGRLTSRDELEVLAPFGLDDIYNGIVRPTPHFKQYKLFEFKIRQDRKKWSDRWPDLDIQI